MHHRLGIVHMAAGAGEFGIGATALFVEVDAVPAGRQALGFNLEHDALGCGGNGDRAARRTIRTLEVTDASQGRKQGSRAQREACGEDVKRAQE